MKFHVALAQMKVASSLAKNLNSARAMALYAKEQGADIFVLPEMFCCPYENESFRAFAQDMRGEVPAFLQDLASTTRLLVVGGSMPEQSGKALYNTSLVYDEAGVLIAKHRKRRLFDIDIKGGQYFRESDTFTSGDSATVFDTRFARIGLGICFDMRFPLDAREMAQQGAKLLLYPAAFNITTGPLHWELLLRTRAVDNLVFTAAAAPARNRAASYKSYGNSMACDPFGRVLVRASSKESLLIVPIDMEEVTRARQAFPYHLY